MKTQIPQGEFAFERARHAASKTGLSQVVFQKGSRFVVVPRQDGTLTTCIRTGELLGWKVYKTVQVLK